MRRKFGVQGSEFKVEAAGQVQEQSVNLELKTLNGFGIRP
jgi:hypothetical protein